MNISLFGRRTFPYKSLKSCSSDKCLIWPQPLSIYDIPLVYLRLSAILACTKANATLTARSPQLIYLYRGAGGGVKGEMAKVEALLLLHLSTCLIRTKAVFIAQDADISRHSLQLWPLEPIHSFAQSYNTLSKSSLDKLRRTQSLTILCITSVVTALVPSSLSLCSDFIQGTVR